jgi:hypothetical protein
MQVAGAVLVGFNFITQVVRCSRLTILAVELQAVAKVVILQTELLVEPTQAVAAVVGRGMPTQAVALVVPVVALVVLAT